jgi:prepilin-type N-terminal cleavage/methylation domain-containing protein
MPARHAGGFTLIETLVAVSLLAVGIGGLAQVLLAGHRAQRVAATTTMAALLAVERLEELRSRPMPTLGGSIDQDVAGFVDRFDARGRLLVGAAGEEQAALMRRWSVQAFAAAPAATLLVQVRVVPGGLGTAGARALGRLPGEVRLATLLVRRSS